MLAAMAKSDRLLILNSDAPIDLDDGKIVALIVSPTRRIALFDRAR
jgi:hypothetical protein